MTIEQMLAQMNAAAMKSHPEPKRRPSSKARKSGKKH